MDDNRYGLGYAITLGSDIHAQMYELNAFYERCRREQDVQAAYALDPSLRPKRDVYYWYDPAELIGAYDG